jgi:hypothetical protein
MTSRPKYLGERLSRFEVLGLLRIHIKRAGSLRAYARQQGYSAAYLSDVMLGRRAPGRKILEPLNLVAQREPAEIRYVEGPSDEPKRSLAPRALVRGHMNNPFSLPWKMCRTCHRIGVAARWYVACRTRKGDSPSAARRRKHKVEPRGICGQCGKIRPLVECHEYDFRPVKEIGHRSRAGERTGATHE